MAGAPEYKKLFRSKFGLEVIVNIVDITDAEAEAVVTGEETTLQHKSLTTEALIREISGFNEKREELKRKSDIKAWTVRKSPLSKSSKFKFVFHAFFETKDSNWVKNMIELYGKVLKKAEKRRIETLAIPLLGSGRGGANVEEAVQALVTATANHKPSSIKKVLLVSKEWVKADKMSTQCAFEFNSLTQETRKSLRDSFTFRNLLKRVKPGTSSKSQASGTLPATDVKRPISVFSDSELSKPSPGNDPQKRWTTCGPPEAISQLSVTDQQTVTLTNDSQEYSCVAESFMCCFQTQPTIMQIDRIENGCLKIQFDEKRRQIFATQNSNSIEVERVLWHHTSADSSKFICTNGFNRSYCGKDGKAGDGVYFTTNPCAHKEDTSVSSTIDKCVFRARVLTGTFIVGTRGNRIAPQRTPGLLYDSTVDDENNPQLFVIYNDTQAYPEYLITYR